MSKKSLLERAQEAEAPKKKVWESKYDKYLEAFDALLDKGFSKVAAVKWIIREVPEVTAQLETVYPALVSRHNFKYSAKNTERRGMRSVTREEYDANEAEIRRRENG